MVHAVQHQVKTLMITGATDGIGKFTAQQCGRAGHHVLVHGRNAAKVAAVCEEINENEEGSAEGFVADLSSLDEVRNLGRQVNEKYESIDGLLNNAGTFAGDYTGKRKTTRDGNEYSLAVNVLAPFLLTSILLDTVRSSQIGGRILVTSSISMGAASALDDLQLERTPWTDHKAYSLSKLCDAMIAFELHDRYGNPPQFCVNTMDPGTVNTRMLKAGWGFGGMPVTSATRSFEMLTDAKWGTKSGQIEGAFPDAPVKSQEARRRLWNDLSALTGAVYPSS